ncbi:MULTISPECIES: hypothetical protein [unclassified Micromonospora]|uniref:hypothetical protein n=1 Tax=Micromonospora sp. b486 TaxID=3053986 RepID=UPI001C231775|nr:MULTISPECIES: hypothetical protein [unclassified Micromonospora]MBU8858075.1 hypothetical protein [Micromonospora sp. WMMB482]MDM4778007.1 hypothetical protein [Micromonospora sp. b486]MDM4783715.1 hypothetical protein [Micromonospora sp. b486]
MVRRGWGGSTAAALGVAAGAGAAQLGFGYGLGIINWAPAGAVRAEAAWVASLAWATWIAATSVIVGAVCAQRLRGGDDEPRGALPRLGLALAAGVGAIVTVLLVAVPARAARVPDVSAPQAVAAAYAGAGLLLGVLLAVWALHTRAAATNLIATTGWLWLLAVVSVVDGVVAGRGLTTAQLGIWQISADRGAFWIRDYFYWPGALLSVLSALVIGLVAARRAARAPEIRVGAAASGAAGPLLVALAYLLAVPRLAGIAAEQLSAHLIAPYAVIAGVSGSMVMAALAQRAERRSAERATVPRQRTGEPDAISGEPKPTPAEPGGPSPSDPSTSDTSLSGAAASRRSDSLPPAASGAPASGPVGASASGRSASALSDTSTGTAPESSARSSRDAAAEDGSGAASGRTDSGRGRATRSAGGRRGQAVPPQRQPEASAQAVPAGPRDRGSNTDEPDPQGAVAEPQGSPATPPPGGASGRTDPPANESTRRGGR